MLCSLNLFKDDSNALETQIYISLRKPIYHKQNVVACQTKLKQNKMLFV